MPPAESTTITTLPVFETVPRRFHSFIVKDDGFEPTLCCGEIAVIDTDSREPVDGEFVFYRSEWKDGHQTRVHEAIVRLHLRDHEKDAHQRAVMNGHALPWWDLVYGRQPVGNWQPCDHWWAPDGYVTMNDGPICDQNLRPLIVGRIVGVMRAVEGSVR